MVIKTASLREINKLPKTAYKVLVTRFYPFYMKDLRKKINEYLLILSPSMQLLKNYREELKRVKDPQAAWRMVHYDSRFRRQILRDTKALGELKRIRDIGRKLKGRRVVYLICHEPTDDFCHRRILKELMENYEL